MPEPHAAAEVKIYHLRPEGPFWRLSLGTDPGAGARFFDSWERALGAAIDLAEHEAPSRLLVYRGGGDLEADLGFRRTDS